jgi:hypothetical protein
MLPGQRTSVVIKGHMTRNICKYGIYVVNAKIVVISSDMVKVPRTKSLPFTSIYDHIYDATKQFQCTAYLFLFIYALFKDANNT